VDRAFIARSVSTFRNPGGRPMGTTDKSTSLPSFAASRAAKRRREAAIRATFGVCLCARLALGSAPAAAQISSLALTTAGITDGFNLTPFVTGFPGSGMGPLGLVVAPNGNVIIDSTSDGRNYVFADIDGQTIADNLSSTPFTGFSACIYHLQRSCLG